MVEVETLLGIIEAGVALVAILVLGAILAAMIVYKKTQGNLERNHKELKQLVDALAEKDSKPRGTHRGRHFNYDAENSRRFSPEDQFTNDDPNAPASPSCRIKVDSDSDSLSSGRLRRKVTGRQQQSKPCSVKRYSSEEEGELESGRAADPHEIIPYRDSPASYGPSDTQRSRSPENRGKKRGSPPGSPRGSPPDGGRQFSERYFIFKEIR